MSNRYDPVIESNIVEKKFNADERRRLLRARKIDARQYVRLAWGYLATVEEQSRMMGATAREVTERGLSGKDAVALIAALASGSGSIIAAPTILRSILVGVTALILAYPITRRARRVWQRWSKQRLLKRVEQDLVLLRSAVVLFLADHFYALLNSNEGLGHLEALLHQSQKSEEAKHLALVMSEGIVYANALAQALQVRPRSDDEVMAQGVALRATVMRLHNTICKVLATRWSTDVKKGPAGGAYKLWDRFIDEYCEYAGGAKLWGNGDPLAGLNEKLPEFPGG